jgi:hypothetical protein
MRSGEGPRRRATSSGPVGRWDRWWEWGGTPNPEVVDPPDSTPNSLSPACRGTSLVLPRSFLEALDRPPGPLDPWTPRHAVPVPRSAPQMRQPVVSASERQRGNASGQGAGSTARNPGTPDRRRSTGRPAPRLLRSTKAALRVVPSRSPSRQRVRSRRRRGCEPDA